MNNKLEDDVEVAFSVIMMDIDNFKQINDIYGHGVGDEARHRANAMKKLFLMKPGQLKN